MNNELSKYLTNYQPNQPEQSISAYNTDHLYRMSEFFY